MATIDERVAAALEDPALADHPLRALCQELAGERQKLRRRLDRIGRISDSYQSELRELNRDLTDSNEKLAAALSEVRTLRGFIPMCSKCKKVRDDEGFWDDVESYLGKHSSAVLSQGVCPDCIQGLERALPSSRAPRAGEAEQERKRLATLLSEEAFAGNPLRNEHVDLSGRYVKIARRLEKISKIADGFQNQLKDLNIKLQRASLTDPLTGMANRRAMVERLVSEVNRSARDERAFSLVMVDVDKFKSINDTYGHEAGDMVLKDMAAILQSNIRSFDLCARWGGEEFLILLAEAETEAAAEVAEELRARCAEHSMVYADKTLSWTFSGGIATYDPRGDMEETLREADRALYAAKQAGRNRVLRFDSL